jgi:hypothetical protein
VSHLDPIERDLLGKGYGFAIDEYRFEVRLGWDRARDYLIINLGLLTVAANLLRIENGRAGNLLVILIFVIGAVTSLLGAKAVVTGHRYYRRAVFKKTLFEYRLGLLAPIDKFDQPDATFAVGTTRGMADVNAILRAPAAWIGGPLSRQSIVFYLACLLRFLALVNAAGIVVAGMRFARATPTLWTVVMRMVAWMGF